MDDFPISIDTLIRYVEQQHRDDTALDFVAEAQAVSVRLSDQADELLGHFVSRARRSGHSWTDIGSRMGVTKQAVRKRFTPRWDGSDPIPKSSMHSRFTLYARRALLAAAATASHSGAPLVDTDEIAAALLSEPDGLAARIIAKLGIGESEMLEALGTTLQSCDVEPTVDKVQRLLLTDAATAALESAHAASLRLGHNYIGTEHILLGIVSANSPTADTLRTLGLSAVIIESAINEAITQLQSDLAER